jgi:hypothetical protein
MSEGISHAVPWLDRLRGTETIGAEWRGGIGNALKDIYRINKFAAHFAV